MTDEAVDLEALWASCTRFLSWHGHRSPKEQLDAIPSDTVVDRYGDGGVVAELESEVASLLGKPAAVFMPGGTMAQQIVLRIHADRRGRRSVLFHPACHLDNHEGRGYERLHGLTGRPTGELNRLLTLDDLQSVGEPPAAVLLELPQRDLGGQLPSWEDLVAQVQWAHERGAAVHMDGARLWQCTPFYGKSLEEIADPFDTVYVSFYKDLGGLTGACVAGPEDVIAEAREWRTRHGGTLFAMWPYAALDLAALRLRLPRIPRYFEHAAAIAEALRDLPGVDVVPDPPQATMMHLLLHADADALESNALRLARDKGVWNWMNYQTTTSPEIQKTELVVGDATLEIRPDEFRDAIEELL